MPYTQTSTIDSFHWLNNESSNHIEYKRLVSFPREDIFINIEDFAGVKMIKVVESNTLFTIALVSETDERVLYYIKCEVWEHLKLGKPVTQLKLWRTINPKYQAVTSGLPSKVFAKLLDDYNVIASDGVHTYSGKRFWQQEMSRAIYEGLHVYRLDSMYNTLTEITDCGVIADNSIDLWGDDEKYMQILAVISKEKLDKYK